MLKCIISDEKDEDGNSLEFLIEPSGPIIESDIAESGGKKDDTIISEKKLNKISKIIPFLSKKIHNSIDEFENKSIKKPSELSLEFSIGFNLEGNLFIAKASMKTQFKVQIIWKHS